MKSMRSGGISLVIAAAVGLFGAVPALGATHTWIGPSGGLWSTAANWSGGVPTTGETGGTIVQFGANTTSTMNISGLVVDQIDFTGANNTINGTTALGIDGVNLFDNIVSGAGSNTLASNLPITLTGAAMVVDPTVGNVTIQGAIGGAENLILQGAVGASLSLTAVNTYSGSTTVESGALHIGTVLNGDVIVGPSLTIGMGSGPGAQLVMDNSSDISTSTAVTVDRDGAINFNLNQDFAQSLTINGGTVTGATLQMTGPLVMNGGTLGIAGLVRAGSLSMTGGTITGPGPLELGGNIQATSSPSGPATVGSPVQLGASPTVTVTPGSAPELTVSGAISETNGSQSVTKAGGGTMVSSGSNTYTGLTTVSAGTLIANGSNAGAFSVGANGTLAGSGTVGATTVAGVLAPTAPGLGTGALTFGPGGRLDDSITSTAATAVPTTTATGAVSIDPSATLNLNVASGLAMRAGTHLVLIKNDGSGAIGGRFGDVPAGGGVVTPDGVPLIASYAGGGGNDLVFTASNVAPHIGTITATPSSAAVGHPVALAVTASDANQDPLTTTWTFGDGTTGAGATTRHAYAKPGKYTAVATVSDGTAQVQATATVTVTGSAAPRTSTIASSAHGAAFLLTYPRACVAKGTPYSVSLRVTKTKRSAVVRVTRVVFAIGNRSVKTEHAPPFDLRLTVSRQAASGRPFKVHVTAYLTLRGGTRATQSMTATVGVC